MTRDEFLNAIWSRYPALSQELLAEDGWCFGKIRALCPPALEIEGAGVCEPPRESRRDDVLGAQLPVFCARPGDVVAFHRQKGLYLLSPCLTPSPRSLSPQSDLWRRFCEVTKSFFETRQFEHWTTPYLGPSSGVDAHIDAMEVRGSRTGRRFYLPTSPEFGLKKIMAAGRTKVFEIKACFRDDDPSAHHLAEFTMAEWYRAYINKWTLLSDVEDLIAWVSPLFGEGREVRIQRRSLPELFRQRVGIEITTSTTRDQLLEAVRARGLHWSESDDYDDLYFRLYLEYIEPHLGEDGPEAIYDFPLSQGSLARTTSEGWADRFEVYWRGVELANAYQEQNDPDAVERRVRGEIQKRKNLGRSDLTADEDFLSAMRSGFPPSAGIALGLDRLFMLLSRGSDCSK